MSFWVAQPGTGSLGSFQLRAEPAACVGPPERQFFMGGVAMAAAIDAAQRATEQPLLWATIHFVAHGMLGDTVEVDVEVRSGGRSVTQVGVTNRVGERTLQFLSAALGRRTGHPEVQFVSMPDVPAPQDCPLKDEDAFAQDGNLLSQFERRVAFVDEAAGIEHLWIRPTFACECDAALLALTSDFFLGAHRLTRGGTSLDNTFRLHATAPTPWILSATRLAGFVNGAVHGAQQQFAQDGTLLSTSSQTGLLPRQAS